jgi:hypothetical protein
MVQEFRLLREKEKTLVAKLKKRRAEVFLNIPYDKKFERLFLAYIAGISAYAPWWLGGTPSPCFCKCGIHMGYKFT